MNEHNVWRPTTAHARALISSLLFALAAVIARRPDLLVLGTPFVGSAVWAVALRPRQPLQVTQTIGHSTVREGEATVWHVSVLDPDGLVEDVAAVLDVPGWFERQPREGQTVVSLRDDGDAPLAVAVRSTRWGRRRVGPALVVASSCWAGFRSVDKGDARPRMLVTLPFPAHFDASAPPVSAPGLIGLNRSPRQGSGSEFAGIRAFQAGDRLRRIHWPRSIRTGTLHVTTTWADHDRHVVLLIDAMEDVGESGGIDGSASSLDTAVRAAAAIGEHYVACGDRVSLVMLGAHGVQRVPPGSGHHHLRRLLETMANVQPANSPFDDGRLPPGLGAGALVLMLSPLVSSAALRRAATIAEQGLSLVVVDCLPSDIASQSPEDPLVGIAWRIELLKRENEIRRMRESGIAVVSWEGPGSLDIVLRDLQRRAANRVGGRA